jgi:hypothetical protein
MKRLVAGLPLAALAALAACGPASPPSAPTTAATSGSASSPPASSLPKEKEEATPKGEGVEQAAKAFFEALAAGDCKGARERSMSFDEMASMSKKATDRAEYDASLGDQIERLCHELSGRGIKIVETKVHHRRTATVAENPEKVKRDVELAAISAVFELDGTRQELLPLTFVKVGPTWKFTTKNS